MMSRLYRCQREVKSGEKSDSNLMGRREVMVLSGYKQLKWMHMNVEKVGLVSLHFVSVQVW